MKPRAFRKFLLLTALTTPIHAQLSWDADTATAGAQDGSGIWNTSNTNWWSGSSNVSFISGGDAVFGSPASAGTIAVDAGGVTAGTVTFNTVGGSSYAFTGGTITAASVIKNGANGVRFDNVNNFTSVTVNNGANSQADGALRLGVSGALGTAPITFANTASVTGLYFLTGFGNNSTFPNNVAFSTASTAGLQTRLLLASNTAGGPQVVTFSGLLTGGSSTSKIRTDGTAAGGQSVVRLTNAGNTVTVSEWEMWRGALEVTSDGALGNASNALRLNVAAGGDPAGTGFRFGANNITLAATRNFIVADRTNVNTQTFTGSRIDSPVTFTGQMIKKGATDLVLAGTNTGAGGIRLDAGTVSLFNPGAAGTGAVTHAGGSLRFSFGDGTTTTWSNNLALNATGHTTFIIRGTNDAAPTLPTTVRLTGLISGGAAGQAYTIAQTNVSGNHNNVLILDNASNSFSGQVVMDRGTLAITSNAALGNANNGIRINTWNLNGALRFDADNITLPATRAIALADGTNLSPINTQAFNSTIEGIISGTGTLVKQGAGTLLLTGSNTSTGATTVAAGTLEIGGSGRLGAASHNGAMTIDGTLRFNTSSSQTLGGAISGAGALIKDGTSVLTLNGSATGFSGSTAVNAGTLILNGSAASNISVAGGASFGGNGLTTGSLTLGSGSSFAVGTGTFIASGGVTIGGPVSVVFAAAPAPGTYPILEYGDGGLVGNVSDLTSTSGRASFSDDPLTKSIVLNVTTGTRTWATTDGTWDLGVSENFAEDDKKFFAGDSVVFPTRPGPSLVALDGNLVPFQVTADHASDYQLGGTGFLSGDMTLTKRGAGSMTIGTPNTYTGITTLEDGTLVAANPTAFGTGLVYVDGGTLGLGGQTIANGLQFAGGAIAGPGTAAGAMSGDVVVSAGLVAMTGNLSGGTVSINGGATLSVGAGGTTGALGSADVTISPAGNLTVNRSNAFTLANNLTGGGSLAQAGSAVLTLTGSNSHTGGTTIATSSLNVPNPSALGSGAVTILPAAASGVGGAVSTLYFNNTAAVACANAIILPSPDAPATYTIMKQSSGQLTGTPLDLTGGISGGNANTTLRLNSNTGGDRTTTYRLAGVNTFAGNLEIYRGAVIITNNQSLGTARLLLNSNNNATDGDVRFENPVTLTNEIVLANTSNVDPIHTGGHTVTLTGPISGVVGGFGLSKIGEGTLILSGLTTYAANTSILAGTLALDGDATLGSSPNILVAGGARFDVSAVESTYLLPVGKSISGQGIIAGAFTSLGAIVPGAAAATLGTLTFEDPLTLDGGTLSMEFDSRNGQHDRVVVEGDLDVENFGIIALTDLAGLSEESLTPGTKIALVEYTGVINGLLDINSETQVADGATVTVGVNSFVLDYDDTTDGVNTGKFLTLTVPGGEPSAFATWAAAQGLDGTPGKENGKFDDPDGDGSDNFVEFFLGGSPLDGGSIGQLASVTTDRLILTFAAPTGTVFTDGVAVVDGVTCTVQGSLDLQGFGAAVTKLGAADLSGLDWAPVPPTGWEYHSFQLDDSVGLDERGFMRLLFTPMP